jgi:glycerol-3-phosphate dehydrogenase subunit B
MTKIESDIMIIGSGMAGMSAALFGSNEGLNVSQVGGTGGMLFSGGYFDLLGKHQNKTSDDPWKALESLIRDYPDHPYAKISRQHIEIAFEELLLFLKKQGLVYRFSENQNQKIITSFGALKESYCLTQSIYNGVKALAENAPSLIVDFKKLVGFSAIQIKNALKFRWPKLRTTGVPFPADHIKGQLQIGEITAYALESPESMEKLVSFLKDKIKDAKYVGFPAVLGIEGHQKVMAKLENLLKVTIFEIPTFPLSIPGLRLERAFNKGLYDLGVKRFHQFMTESVTQLDDGRFQVKIKHGNEQKEIISKSVILASGRFLGKGLSAKQNQVRETVFGLPVSQPKHRSEWHSPDFFDPKGNPINRAGLKTDHRFCPTDNTGNTVYENLFAAGTILADQDWIRSECGSGLSISTAYGAVKACLNNLTTDL